MKDQPVCGKRQAEISVASQLLQGLTWLETTLNK